MPQACKFLASTSTGVVRVALEGSTADQDFEFDFSLADDRDLDGVDAGLYALIDGRSLTINSIEAYLQSTTPFASARRYRDSIANYLYGVLARENSSESGLVDIASSSPRYTERFDDAVAELGRYERPPAEAISGLVAFHYNHFDLALRKTRSPRVARVAMRFACLLRGFAHTDSEELDLDQDSLDYTLSDTETERVLVWTSIPLDGTANVRVVEIEDAIPWVVPDDAMKLRMIAAEHHLVAGDTARGLAHVSALRHTRALEKWSEWYRERAVGQSR